jgi:signal transduction histidine kinase
MSIYTYKWSGVREEFMLFGLRSGYTTGTSDGVRMAISIRRQLLLLILGITVPFTLVGVFGLLRVWNISRTQLNDSMQQQAELAALAFERWVDSQRRPLETVAAIAADGKIESLNVVEYGIKTRPYWIDVSIVSAAGEIMRSFPADQDQAPPALIHYLVTETQKRNSWLLVTDRTRDESRPVVAIATPIRGGGAVVLRIDGTAINALFSQIQPAGSVVIAVFDAQGQLLFRKQTADSPLTTDVGSSPLFNALGAKKVTVAELRSPYDNIRRVYGLCRAGPTDFVVAVGIPSATLYEPMRSQFTRYALFSFLAFVSAIVAAILMQRKIVSPMQRLTAAADALGKGDFNVSAPTSAVTEIGELGTTFNKMAHEIKEREARLTELDRLKSDFVSSVSHELRTPLTTISTLTHVLQHAHTSEAERREYLQTIAAECDRQIDLVTNLLDLSRIESGAYKVELGPVDLGQVIQNCLRIIKHTAETRNHEIRADLPQKPITVLADNRTLRRAVCTIAENAIKYTPDCGTITLGMRTAGDDGCIYIKDNGYGISATDLPHIFDRFYQGATKRDVEPGVGLGLYVVRGLIEQLGGTIKVESEVGAGSTFTICLPKWCADEKHSSNGLLIAKPAS